MANAQLFYTDIDLAQNQILNPRYQMVTSFPKSPKQGQYCYLLSGYSTYEGNKPYYYNGREWIAYGTGSGGGNLTTKDNFLDITITNTSTDLSFKNQSKNLFLASPIDSTGQVTFRAIDSSDIPDLSSLYIKNQKAIIQDANFWINSGIFSGQITIYPSLPTDVTNKLYSLDGALYWSGMKVGTESFGKIADADGNPEFEADNIDDTIRFGAGNGLIVSFDSNTKKVTYSLGSSIEVTTTNYYYYEFSLPEFIFNSPQFFYSWAKSSTALNYIRSNSYAGIQNENTVVPIISPITGIIKKAVLQIKGAGVQNGSVTYPVYYKCKLYKVGYTSIGSAYNVYFPISSSFNVATYAPGNTNAMITIENLNINVTKGDMISLQFDPSTGDYGSESTVGHMRNAYVTLTLDDGGSGSSGGGSGGNTGGLGEGIEFDFIVLLGVTDYEFIHNLNKLDLVPTIIDPVTGESFEFTWFACSKDSIGVSNPNYITARLSNTFTEMYSQRNLRIIVR